MLPCSVRSVLLPECIAVATPGGTGSDRSNGRKCLSSMFCRTRTRQRLASTPLQRNSRYLPPPPPVEVSWYFVLLLSISFCVHALLDAAAHSLSRPPISAGFSREARPPRTHTIFAPELLRRSSNNNPQLLRLQFPVQSLFEVNISTKGLRTLPDDCNRCEPPPFSPAPRAPELISSVSIFRAFSASIRLNACPAA